MARRRYLVHAPQADGPLSGTLVVLWHGAGGDVDHPTIVSTGRAFQEAGAYVVRARFPYRVEGRKAPDRMPKLIASAEDLLDKLTADAPLSEARLILGGRSMGGRMASMLAAGLGLSRRQVHGLLLLSYPLHPAGKRDQLRVAHLPDIECPTLFVQGDRDALADLPLLEEAVAGLGTRGRIVVIEKGDHGMMKIDPSVVAAAALDWAKTLPVADG